MIHCKLRMLEGGCMIVWRHYLTVVPIALCLSVFNVVSLAASSAKNNNYIEKHALETTHHQLILFILGSSHLSYFVWNWPSFHFPHLPFLLSWTCPPGVQLGLDHSRLHKLNGIMVLVSFFMCRILIFPFMYWMYGQQFGIPLHRVAFHLPLHCNLGNLLILAPQLYWFVLLLRKAKRLYLRQKRGNEDVNRGNTRTDWRILQLSAKSIRVNKFFFFLLFKSTS